LIEVDADHLRCVPLNRAKQQLDTIWDDYFKYSQVQQKRVS